MISAIARHRRWLHGSWPAGTVEKLPEVDAHYRSNVAGLYIVGDLTGIPLLKFSADSGARAVAEIVADGGFQQQRGDGGDLLDLAIVGAGVSGMSAALAARDAGLSFEVLEATEPFSTIVNFPRRKPIYTYPRDMTPAGSMRFEAEVKEDLLEELRDQTLVRRSTPARTSSSSSAATVPWRPPSPWPRPAPAPPSRTAARNSRGRSRTPSSACRRRRWPSCWPRRCAPSPPTRPCSPRPTATRRAWRTTRSTR